MGIPVPLNQTGFTSFDNLERYIFQNLAAAQNKHQGRPPQIVCESWGAHDVVMDGKLGKEFEFDRRAPVCCKPWSFEEGDRFTVVAFFHPTDQPVGPHAPDGVPEEVNMHVHWLMSYDEHVAGSFYRFGPFGKDMSASQESQYKALRPGHPFKTLQGAERGMLGMLIYVYPLNDERFLFGVFFLICAIGIIVGLKCIPGKKARDTCIKTAKCWPPVAPKM